MLLVLLGLAAVAVLGAVAVLSRRRAAAAVPGLAVPGPAVPAPAVPAPASPEATPVRVLAEAMPGPATISGEVEPPAERESIDPLDAIDALLAELETATVRIDGADELDESAVVELERLADRLEAAAAGLERVA
jgi:hypothetical protein